MRAFVFCMLMTLFIVSSDAQVFIPFSFWNNLCRGGIPGPIIFNYTGANQIYTVPAVTCSP
jgi:hypothetical protein